MLFFLTQIKEALQFHSDKKNTGLQNKIKALIQEPWIIIHHFKAR